MAKPVRDVWHDDLRMPASSNATLTCIFSAVSRAPRFAAQGSYSCTFSGKLERAV